jgi:enoyl-CoA hydratase
MLLDRNFSIGYLAVERSNDVAVVSMERPEKLNAMTLGFWRDLREVLDLLMADRETRAVVITGAGEKAFSAGGDIVGFTELKTIEEMRNYQIDVMSTFAQLERCPLMVISAVNGLAFGGGFELALASDMVIASETATFALPEAALGLVPGFGALRGPDVIGRQMTKYLIATGEVIDARRALEIGLVQLVVAKHELLSQARQAAARIAARSPLALSVAKRMVNRTIDETAQDYSIREITKLQASQDRAEGVAAFLRRRAPVFGVRQDGEEK